MFFFRLILLAFFLGIALPLAAQSTTSLQGETRYLGPIDEQGTDEQGTDEQGTNEPDYNEPAQVATPAPIVLPVPQGLRIVADASPEAILDAFLKVPYRVDGAISEDGEFTLWANPDKVFSSPGLNCSGFLVAAARFLKGVNFSLQNAKKDILKDSGPGAEYGEDWDFGLDVLINLAGVKARLLPDSISEARSVDERGRILGLGVDIQSPALEETIASLRPDKLYFFVISKPDRRFAGGLSYYHNGLIFRGAEKQLWLYQATHRAGVHRIDLASDRGLARFRSYFPQVSRGERRILFVETDFSH